VDRDDRALDAGRDPQELAGAAHAGSLGPDAGIDLAPLVADAGCRQVNVEPDRLIGIGLPGEVAETTEMRGRFSTPARRFKLPARWMNSGRSSCVNRSNRFSPKSGTDWSSEAGAPMRISLRITCGSLAATRQLSHAPHASQISTTGGVASDSTARRGSSAWAVHRGRTPHRL
jgi:hypothetical protein